MGRAATGDRESLAELRMLLHRIAGAAGSYGFHDATARARVAEASVAKLLEDGTPLTSEISTDIAQRIADVGNAFPRPG